MRNKTAEKLAVRFAKAEAELAELRQRISIYENVETDWYHYSANITAINKLQVENKQLAQEAARLTDQVARLEAVADAARDVEQWLSETTIPTTEHEKNLAAALAELDTPKSETDTATSC